MSHRGILTAAITTVLGATLGGLLIWRVIRAQRKKLPPIQKEAEPVEPPRAVEKEVNVCECQPTQLPPPSVQIPSPEQLLGVKPVMVSCEEEWQQLWPSLQEELSVYPVLGLDCEWVKNKGVRNTFCMFSLIEDPC